MKTVEGGPVLSGEEIAALESKNGITLPDSYRAFLLETNGGRPERDLFTVPGYDANPVGRVHFFFGLNDSVQSCNLDWNREVFADRIPEHMLPIATTEGVDKICISLASDTLGAVYFWDGYGGAGRGNLHLVAESFDRFLEKLHRDEHSPGVTD